ncbi:MAG: efflux RND transporter periplasmic adaptor subunit [Ignavibacteria bacterium]
MKHSKILKMRNLVYSLLFIMAAGMILASCGGDGETKTEPENKQLQAVKIKDVVTQGFEETFSVVGIVKAFQTANVASEEGGLITYQPFDKGSRISRGQVVVRLRKDQDRASYEQASTQFELAKSNFERMEKLYNEKVATEQDYTNAQFQLELAERSLDVLETRLNKSYIVSPISGIVDQKFLSKGEVCSPGSPILNVVDVSRVKISGGIPERFISDIRKETDVRITFDVYPGEEFTGNVSYVSPTISPLNRTFEIEVILNNKEGRFKPEMSSNMEIKKSSSDDVIVLPQDLIVDLGNDKYVFVLEGDIAKKRIVSISGRNGNDVLINSGLNPGEKLIVEGFQSLADGDKVLVIN